MIGAVFSTAAMRIEIQDQNIRAASPLALVVGAGAAWFAGCAVLGHPTEGVAGSIYAGWWAIELVYAFPAWVEKRILPQLRPRRAVQAEEEAIKAKYRREAERAAGAPKTDETPRRVDLDTKYTGPKYKPLRPKRHRGHTWKESENAIEL